MPFEVTMKSIRAITLLLLSVSACSNQAESPPSRSIASPSLQAAQAPKPTRLTEVTDVSQVCMVNDQFMGRPQIPVPVAGRTYYGCCEMCKGKLEREETARTASDPVSGHVVDKATAVIGKTETGQVLYFESRASLAAYRPN